jgi:hypothetical protein
MVPPAEFTSYYGRPIVKASPWEHDIPAYLFLGGVAAGSSLLSAGADLTDRPALRRTGRLAALVGLTLSMLALVKDLGRPERFLNMLRVVKVTSPMSVGTWILTAYGPFAGLAAVSELRGLLPRRLRCSLAGRLLGLSGRPAGLAAAVVARPSPPTPQCCSLTRPRRPGTPPTGTCRSSSSARPARPRAAWA